jgi:hypothetical protein
LHGAVDQCVVFVAWEFLQFAREERHSITGKHQFTVGANRKGGVAGEAVVLARFGTHIDAQMTFEGFAVSQPIAVETELPDPRGREADDFAILWLVKKVSHDHDVIRWSTLMPTVEGDDFAFVVQVIDLGELPAEAASAFSLWRGNLREVFLVARRQIGKGTIGRGIGNGR